MPSSRLKLSGHKWGLPRKVVSCYIVPLTEAGLATHVPAKRTDGTNYKH